VSPASAPKVAKLLTEAEEDLLAFYRAPPTHRPKLRSTNNLERVNQAITRRSDVVGIFPTAVIRLVGALLIEQNDEWLLTRGSSPRSRSPWSSRTKATRTEARWRPWSDERSANGVRLHHNLRPDSSSNHPPSFPLFLALVVVPHHVVHPGSSSPRSYVPISSTTCRNRPSTIVASTGTSTRSSGETTRGSAASTVKSA
jgi:Transposase, Mutator family